MTNARAFDHSRDLIRVGGKDFQLSERQVAGLKAAEAHNLLPHRFLERARGGLDRNAALTALVGAMRKCVNPSSQPLVDLLAVVVDLPIKATVGLTKIAKPNRQAVVARERA